jgi:hypothetical protein
MGDEAGVKLIRHTKETYGGSFTADLFEQYKLYVRSAEMVSERRISANNCLLTVNSFLVTLYGLLAASRYKSYWTILVPIAGLLVSLTWLRIITSYRDLNAVSRTWLDVLGHAVLNGLVIASYRVRIGAGARFVAQVSE